MINQLAKEIMEWRESKGFYTPISMRTVKERDLMLGKLMLVSSEIGEAAEAVRKADFNNFAEELADACIRIFDISATMQIDLEAVIINKMNVNRDRPYRHDKNCSL